MSARKCILLLSAWALMLAIIGSGEAYAAETLALVPEGTSPLVPQAATGQGTPQGMMMVCPMMAGMGMSGMNMSGMSMSGTNAGGLGMNHGTGTATSLTDLAQNVSMRDLTQLLQDLVAIQERMLAAIPQKQANGIRRDLDRVKERSGELLTEIRGMVSAAARGE